MSFTFSRRRAVASLALLAASGSAAAQDAYPSKPITLVVPWPPGGFNDVLGRTVAGQLQQTLGQTVNVENRGGANGMLGTDHVAKQPADGYTLMFHSVTSHAVNPFVYSKVPYSTEKDIMPLAVVASVPLLLVANPSFPAKSLTELIALARKQPDGLSYASFGNGSASHLAGALFARQAGLRMNHVPYKGGGPALTDTLGGQVPMFYSAFGLALPHIKAGKLVALGTTGPTRSKQLPEVPTIAEAADLKGYEMAIVYALWAPSGLKPDVLARIEKAIENVVGSPAFRERLAGEGADPMRLLTPAESRAYFTRESVRLGKIVKDNAISLD
jgi:tripartite-type tricarboxylate transporter receptor subunit TctC